MDSVKPMRLNKAARVFNISTQTVVEFLAKKGYKIDDPKPNTKLEPEMVVVLEKEFHNDKVLKQEITERTRAQKKKLESIAIEDVKEEPKEEQEIDIDIQDSEVKSDEKEEVKAEETVEERNDDVVTEEEKEVNLESGVEVEAEIEVEKEEEKIVAVEEVEAVVQEEVQEEKVDEEAAPKEIEEEKIAEKKEEEKDTEIESEEKQSGIKVVGKIDIDSINQKTRPEKKTRAQRKKEAEQRKKETESKKQQDTRKKAEIEREKAKAAEEKKKEEVKIAEAEKAEKAAEQKKAAEQEKEDNFIKTKYEKLDGVSVVGKIDLPVDSRQKKKNGKKLVASSKDAPGNQNKKKNKRPRIDKQAKVKTGQKTGQKEGDRKGGKQVKKGHKHVQKHEPTEEEIQKQLKETLARLQQSTGGKSKASKHRREKRAHIADTAKQKALDEENSNILKVTEFLTANELASMMDVNVIDVINKCMALGVVVSINQRLDAETISIVAEEFGYITKFVDVDEEIDAEHEEEADSPEDLISRTPIVTVMGHVDHGKTKLLDYIRHSNVVAGEAGGITQHIGAYEVELPDGRKITFLDTPGHEAFTAMRARGAKVTDVAIIVIAADDAVMPQTKEAITHAQAAGVPIVFAFNKMDKPGASADKIREQLANMNILVEEWGGKYQAQEISAITGMGVNELLEKVLLEAEMLELKANPNKPATGTVLEASLDKGRGYVANILVQNGTLRRGDILVAGPVYGKVKALYNERNKLIAEAGPSTPALLLGLTGAPQAGDLFKVYNDEKEARSVANKRQQLLREQSLRTKKHITLDEIGRRLAIGDFKELNLIVKGDVDGSIEALSDELLKLSTEEVQVNIIHKAVGAITETDVMLASASDAIIIGFMVRPTPQARKLAETEQVDIKTYSIIYQAKEEIEDAIKGMLTTKTEEKVVCNLEVRETFKVSKVGTVAGCYVLDGKITRNTKIRLIRDGIVVYTGNLGSLKRFKDDVKEVSAGYECGLNIENFNDIKVGDIIEGYEIVEV